MYFLLLIIRASKICQVLLFSKIRIPHADKCEYQSYPEGNYLLQILKTCLGGLPGQGKYQSPGYTQRGE